MHGAEPLELPGGALDTLRLERLPRNGRDQKAEPGWPRHWAICRCASG
jgi:hypothetical protein